MSRYEEELLSLPSVYATSLGLETCLARVVAELGDRPVCFVGSGGALAVAEFARDLHRRATGHLAVSMTPLEVARGGLLRNTGLVVFSASGRNPDAALALEAGRSGGYRPLGLVTCRPRPELPDRATRGPVTVVEIEAPKDGFLATGSVLAMCVGLCQAYDFALPSSLPSFEASAPPSVREECIVLTGPSNRAVASDLEARLSETGLSAAQRADYRNFAHGRHVGLVRRIDRTSMVLVVDAESRKLATRVSSLLPAETDVARLESELSFPVSVLDLLVLSMRLTASTARGEFDPARPGVGRFGRQLYRMPVARLLAPPATDAVERKLESADSRPTERSRIERALGAWKSRVASEPITGLVLDYDGTCCTTAGRYDPPSVDIRERLLELTSAGLCLGFASGRGKSLHKDLRSWIPEETWPKVTLGLYNGSVVLRLADDLPAPGPPSVALAAAAERLRESLLLPEVALEVRATQISMTGAVTGQRLARAVASLLARQPQIDCKILISAHSVDVVERSTSKTKVLHALARGGARGGAIMAIGDQGHVGGNDFELLAATEFSVSVDRVSPDPTRCWNLGSGGVAGPDLLIRYLKALVVRRRGVFFKWRR